MDLIEASVRADDLAKRRGFIQTTFEALKHCAGEVLEANEAYNDWTFLETDRNLKEQFEDELADIIMCVLSLCGAEGINIEKALERCFEKKRKKGNKGEK